MVHGIYPIKQRGVWNAVHGQLVLQQLMSACGIAAHDVLTDEEVEDSEEEDDSLSDFLTD